MRQYNFTIIGNKDRISFIIELEKDPTNTQINAFIHAFATLWDLPYNQIEVEWYSFED